MNFSMTTALAAGFGARAIATAENKRPVTKKVSVKFPSTNSTNALIIPFSPLHVIRVRKNPADAGERERSFVPVKARCESCDFLADLIHVTAQEVGDLLDRRAEGKAIRQVCKVHLRPRFAGL